MMRHLVAVIFMVCLVGCFSWNQPISQAPKPGYPCGIDGAECYIPVPGKPNEVEKSGTCCDEGQVCGTGSDGCPGDSCCDEDPSEDDGDMQASRGMPKKHHYRIRGKQHPAQHG